ncbi:aminoglycoside phosphotransferase family protein [Calidifontibacter sp. DB0510]|uniref:Aminoglycoside phosphotransferase family protein n=2 Tax=Metallococcus carri TaxID=1656884 RepID=A0A967EFS6_9MICO|nr:aminoglycoside phosphotransferase family protein [Metallococcus carri]NOP37656.1 aminoglycoside phosphotransferase family protein [Calidifontibacter sp. DB2511S]
MDQALASRGVTRVPTTPLQPRVRPWSTQLVAETSQGRVWCKASVPEATSETAVYDLLTDVAPDLMPPVWAADPAREWLLVPDQGTTLREVATADTIVSLLSGMLRRYARLQRASIKVTDALVARGVPLLAPADLVAAWDELGIHPECLPALRAAAERLDAVGLPLTIQHDDLHSGNVFADGSSAGGHEARIFDWGDAYVGNPLCSLLIALRDPSNNFDLPDDAGRDARLLRAYLTCWSDVAPTAELLSVVPDALLLARVGRILGWQRALSRSTAAERDRWRPSITHWIAEVVAESR